MEDFGKIMLSRDLFANEHELFLGRNMYQECRLRLSLSLPAPWLESRLRTGSLEGPLSSRELAGFIVVCA